MFNSDIVFVNVYFDNITFFSDAMSLVHFDLNNVSIDDDNFGDDNLVCILDLWLGLNDIMNTGHAQKR